MIKLAVAEAALPVASLLVGHQVFGLFDETPTALLTASLINSVLFGYKCRGNIVNAAIITALSILSFYLFGFLFGAPLLQYIHHQHHHCMFTSITVWFFVFVGIGNEPHHGLSSPRPTLP